MRVNMSLTPKDAAYLITNNVPFSLVPDVPSLKVAVKFHGTPGWLIKFFKRSMTTETQLSHEEITVNLQHCLENVWVVHHAVPRCTVKLTAFTTQQSSVETQVNIGYSTSAEADVTFPLGTPSLRHGSAANAFQTGWKDPLKPLQPLPASFVASVEADRERVHNAHYLDIHQLRPEAKRLLAIVAAQMATVDREMKFYSVMLQDCSTAVQYMFSPYTQPNRLAAQLCSSLPTLSSDTFNKELGRVFEDLASVQMALPTEVPPPSPPPEPMEPEVG